MFFIFLLLTDEFVPSQIQEKAEIFARGFPGEADAGNLRSGEGEVPGRGEGEVPLQGEDAGGQVDDAPKTGEVLWSRAE